MVFFYSVESQNTLCKTIYAFSFNVYIFNAIGIFEFETSLHFLMFCCGNLDQREVFFNCDICEFCN